MKYDFSSLGIQRTINELDSARVGEAETTPELLDNALEQLCYLQDKTEEQEKRIEELLETVKERRGVYDYY